MTLAKPVTGDKKSWPCAGAEGTVEAVRSTKKIPGHMTLEAGGSLYSVLLTPYAMAAS